jgi:hypothetical protein
MHSSFREGFEKRAVSAKQLFPTFSNWAAKGTGAVKGVAENIGRRAKAGEWKANKRYAATQQKVQQQTSGASPARQRGQQGQVLTTASTPVNVPPVPHTPGSTPTTPTGQWASQPASQTAYPVPPPTKVVPKPKAQPAQQPAQQPAPAAGGFKKHLPLAGAVLGGGLLTYGLTGGQQSAPPPQTQAAYQFSPPTY